MHLPVVRSEQAVASSESPEKLGCQEKESMCQIRHIKLKTAAINPPGINQPPSFLGIACMEELRFKSLHLN